MKGLTREAVLRSAVALADREGLEALSMRRLGQELGVEAMSLYRHVRDKSDLLDGIHGAIMEEIAPPRPSGDWRRDLKALARAFHGVLARHPRAVVLFATRPAVSAGSLKLVERALSLLAAGGLPPARRVQAFEGLVAYVIGQALQHHLPAEAAIRPPDYGALDRREFRQLRALGRHFDADGDRSFAYGLGTFLRGLASSRRRR